MIEVTRLNGETFFVNPHQIEFMEATPDTVITLNSARKIIVRERIDEINQRIVAYRRKLFLAGQEGKLDFIVLIGWGAGLSVIFLLGAGIANLHMFIDIPSMAITGGGTLCGLLAMIQLHKWKRIISVFKSTFNELDYDPTTVIPVLVSFAEKARREGLLALEDDIADLKDQFLKGGIQLVVDGTAPELVKVIMETKIDHIKDRHSYGSEFFRNLSSLAPAFGMIGTLIGLVLMLAQMEDPNAIGPAMAVALITTLYGSILANLIATPVAGKLEERTKDEVLVKSLMVEGMLSIQAGDNPRIVEEKLRAFLSDTEAAQKLQRQQEGE